MPSNPAGQVQSVLQPRPNRSSQRECPNVPVVHPIMKAGQYLRIMLIGLAASPLQRSEREHCQCSNHCQLVVLDRDRQAEHKMNPRSSPIVALNELTSRQACGRSAGKTHDNAHLRLSEGLMISTEPHSFTEKLMRSLITRSESVLPFITLRCPRKNAWHTGSKSQIVDAPCGDH